MSRDGQGGALLRKVAKLDKYEDNTVAIFGRSFWDVQQLSAAMAAALMHPRRGGNAGEEDSQCEPWRQAPSLARSHAMVQRPDQWLNKLRRWRGAYRRSVPRTCIEARRGSHAMGNDICSA